MPVRYAPRDPPATAAGTEEDPTFEGEAPIGPARPPPHRADPPPARRSHAAAFVAVALVLLGVYLASWSLLVPLLLALLLLSTGLTFLGTRLNPLSVGFYLTVKPSWSSIGILFLSGLFLLDVAYSYWKHGWGPILPAHLVPW